MENKPFFSVIIPTRDRVTLFKDALDSVLSQTHKSFDVHVVNDGSSGEHLSDYQSLEKEYSEKVTFHYLVHRPNGHGQSYSMNFGAYHVKGEYLCFLDDDDFWTDTEHLTRAATSLKESNSQIDLYYTNQKAFFSDGSPQTNNVWIEDLISKLENTAKDSQGSCIVDVPTLLNSKGFAHLNCSIFHHQLYKDIVGMDEHIRYECDRDVYIRAIDQANHILYNPAFISQHHIPDPKKSGNMSTAINIYEKKIFQLRVYDKGALNCKTQSIIKFCQTAKGNELKHITMALLDSNRHKDAYYYAKQALGALPTFKWLMFTFLLFSKSLFKK